MSILELRALFLSWIAQQYPNANVTWDDESGFKDDLVNALWIGFCARQALI